MKSATIVFMVSLVLCTSFMSAKNFHALAAHTPHSSVASNYTFSEHIAPIIWKHCVSCHRDGEIAPFSLTNYEEVAENALTIAAVTKSRFMPPWKPTQYARYADERGLTDDEIQILADWAAAGAPQGDPRARDTDTWRAACHDPALLRRCGYGGARRLHHPRRATVPRHRSLFAPTCREGIAPDHSRESGI